MRLFPSVEAADLAAHTSAVMAVLGPLNTGHRFTVLTYNNVTHSTHDCVMLSQGAARANILRRVGADIRTHVQLAGPEHTLCGQCAMGWRTAGEGGGLRSGDLLVHQAGLGAQQYNVNVGLLLKSYEMFNNELRRALLAEVEPLSISDGSRAQKVLVAFNAFRSTINVSGPNQTNTWCRYIASEKFNGYFPIPEQPLRGQRAEALGRAVQALATGQIICSTPEGPSDDTDDQVVGKRSFGNTGFVGLMYDEHVQVLEEGLGCRVNVFGPVHDERAAAVYIEHLVADRPANLGERIQAACAI